MCDIILKPENRRRSAKGHAAIADFLIKNPKNISEKNFFCGIVSGKKIEILVAQKTRKKIFLQKLYTAEKLKNSQKRR